MKKICDELQIDYDKVVEYSIYDKRLGNSHWAVPGPDGKLTEYQIPLITLVPHQNLAIDKVQIEMQVRLSPHSDTKSVRKPDTTKIGRIRKFFTDHSKSGGQSELATIKIKFRGKKPPEGIARIKDQMLKMIPS